MTIITMNYFCNTYFCFKFLFLQISFCKSLSNTTSTVVYYENIDDSVMNCLCSSIVSHFG